MLRITHRFGAKWNFSFLIPFFTIKTKFGVISIGAEIDFGIRQNKIKIRLLLLNKIVNNIIKNDFYSFNRVHAHSSLFLQIEAHPWHAILSSRFALELFCSLWTFEYILMIHEFLPWFKKRLNFFFAKKISYDKNKNYASYKRIIKTKFEFLIFKNIFFLNQGNSLSVKLYSYKMIPKPLRVIHNQSKNPLVFRLKKNVQKLSDSIRSIMIQMNINQVINPNQSDLGFIRIKNLFRFIRIDASDWIGLNRIDSWPFIISNKIQNVFLINS